MWLVVGLGNPGDKYAMNRHNIGFMALDAYDAGLKWKEERGALTCRFKISRDAKSEEVIFVKPQTYMNLSGEPTQSLMGFYKIPLEQLIVLHDDIDQGFGAIKIHKNRGAGGQNGVKSINQMMGSQDYVRIKLGVSRPPHPQMDVASWVLQNFSGEERQALPDILSAAGDAIETLIFDGYSLAATRHTRAANPVTPAS